ncbi:IAA-alanine resistance protein 1 isoform X2 [Brassica rapa]|uniref:IAA-alanine resistance protein 1 isoform X2 n=1 Tax=Brassica campestris TaxID=3711 RepID=UPI00142D6AB9|nr:IAA-alanine resistance protein 1 isoform X2 [Brassica rapa]
MTFSIRRLVVPFLVLVLFLDLCVETGFSHSTPAREEHVHHHGGGCSSHSHDHDHDHHEPKQMKLPEELAEEEDMRLCGFGPCLHHDHQSSSALSGFALWVNALGCSLLVSLASLICLILLPVMFGAMLGDAFLHQLPHAFGGGHSHSSHNHESHVHHDHDHSHSHSDSPSHSHSLQDLSVGLSVLAGIVVFLLVEKLVRYVEENSSGSNTWGHQHHHHAGSKKLKDEDGHNNADKQCPSDATENSSEKVSKDKSLRKRKTSASDGVDKSNSGTQVISDGKMDEPHQVEKNSSLVFGYLNLFSDGVHNFTDGMALGSAFLIYGSVGGWSRTMFLLAHELPQEIGDFGILVRSGFTVSKALFFNFLSALVALAGTALVLVWGNEPGQSSLIEGFTAGGFIYIAVAGVLAEMNNSGKSTLRNSVCHLISLMLGMGVALVISLLE